MADIILKILLVFAVLFAAGHARQTRIVGGRKAQLAEFPSIVSLKNEALNYQHFCGGSIIDSTHIVSAAHCAAFYTAEQLSTVIVASAGDVKISEDACPDRQTIHVRKAVWNDGFNYNDFKSDVAVFTLATPLKFTNFVKPAVLADRDPELGANCVVAGWGTIAENGPLSPELLAALVRVETKEKCRTKLGENEAEPGETQICAGDVGGHRDACQGDSGGPLYCDGKLSGLVSYGEGCATQGKAGVYTSIVHFKDWINNNIKNANSDRRMKSSAKKNVAYSKLFLSIIGILYNTCYIYSWLAKCI